MNLRRAVRLPFPLKICRPLLGAFLSLVLVVQSLPSYGLEKSQVSSTKFLVNDFFQLLDYYPPSTLAKVTDSYLAVNQKSETRNQKLVINIQDLHVHPGVQKEISQLLEYYASKGIATQFVAVEGAQGPVDTTLMALFPDQKIKQEVSEHFLKEGVLTGMEDYAIRNSKPEYLYGVDDQETYNIHKELFRKTLANRSKLASQIQNLQEKLHVLEPQVYSGAMKKLKGESLAYEQGNRNLKDHIKGLYKLAKKADIKFPQELEQMQELLQLETRNRKAETLQSHTKQFLTLLYPRLTKEESDKLANYAKTDNTVYYLYLNILARRHRVLNACPKHLKNFLTYTCGMDSLDMQKFQNQLETLVYQLQLAQSKTPVQKNLIQAQRDLILLKSLVEHKLTEDDFRQILPRTDELLVLLETLLSSEGPTSQVPRPMSDFKELLAESIDFYALALLRDKPLVEKTLKLLSSNLVSRLLA